MRSVKVLIPNATSPKNIGDLAMLTVLLSFLNKNNYKVVVHSVEPRVYKDKLATFKKTLYDWAVISVDNAFVKILRLVQLILYIFMLVVGVNIFSRSVSKNLQNLTRDYESADLVVFVGGGYLRTTRGIKQALNLIMHLIPFYITCKLNKKSILCPISFGPFAYSWQAKLAANVIKNINYISVREGISKKLLNKHGVKNITVSSDHALLLSLQKIKKTRKSKILGFTIRKWGDKESQEKLEGAVVKSLINLAKNKNLTIQPIVQVDAPRFESGDKEIAIRIADKLTVSNIKTLPVVVVRSLPEAINIYSSLELLLGMRMHSNIIAATQGTPFVGIAYEYKTEGIAKQLGLEASCIKSNKVTENRLSKLLLHSYNTRRKKSNELLKVVKLIQFQESRRWKDILSI